MCTNFQKVASMNVAFGNPAGEPTEVNWNKVRKQALNIPDEVGELLIALGANENSIKKAIAILKANVVFTTEPDEMTVRDSLCDINVFSYGAHHLMGMNADMDMGDVVKGVMSRFIKDPIDKHATIKKHAAKGVTQVYFEGDYPKMIMKSAVDQPDAPAGKFLKSASYAEPVFYNYNRPFTLPVSSIAETAKALGAFDPLPGN